MGRPATGYVKWRRNPKTGATHWHAQVTLKDGSRPWVPLDPSIPRDDEAGAKACALRVSDEARLRGIIPDSVRETVGEWFVRFHAAKEARGLATVKDMRGRAKKWILPGIESKDIRAVTREDIEAIVRRLDLVVAAFMKEGPGEGRLAPSTAANVWGDLQHAFDEAVRAKDPSLRVLRESPVRNVRGPEGGDDRQGQILYGDELFALIQGTSVLPGTPDVPLYRRQVYALAAYQKGRSSELEALVKPDVDLKHATVSFAKQADRKSKGRAKTKQTKTRRVRVVDIEPNAFSFVEWLSKHPQGKGGRLLHMPPPEDRAELLRKDLLTVGVTRPALHIENDPNERAIVFHDLRDTGLVHMAVRGDSPIVIQWSAGHTDFKQTSGYIERGQVEAKRIGEPLPPLPPSFLAEHGLGPQTPQGRPLPISPLRRRSGSFATFRNAAKPKPLTTLILLPFQRPQRELNPCYRRERPVS